jgi:nitroreductase
VNDEFDRATVDRLLTTTRSVRTRLELTRHVDLALVDECLTIALQAPNGSGHERWRFVVVSDPAVRAAIGAIYKTSSDGYLAQLRAEDPDLDETTPAFRSSKRLWDHLGDVPVLVVPCVETEPWHRASTQRSYVDASVYASIYPATWSFQLACRSRGLGTCFVTSVLKYDAELRAVLHLPDSFVIGGVVAVAHTSGPFSPARRRPLAEVRHHNRWPDPSSPDV